MKEPENPFTFRSSESIESRLTFLKLFGPAIFDALPTDSFLNKVTTFQSSPGGGKTTLFRIFDPELLVEISRDRTTYREIFHHLRKNGVIGTTGPDLLGVYLRLYDYAVIQDSGQEQSEQYLVSLIGVRLIMKALTGILALKGLGMDHLSRITIQKPQDHYIIDLPLPCDGQKLYAWVSEMERGICGTINRFDTHDIYGLGNLSSITDYLNVIRHDNIFFDDQPIVSKVLVLLDDMHELTRPQRKALRHKIISARLPISIWIAERLEALDISEMVTADGRDSGTVRLEECWEGKAFERFVKSVSEKRTRHASLNFDIDLYQHLEDSAAATTRNRIFQDATDKVKKRIYSTTRGTSTYAKWIAAKQGLDDSKYDDLLSWRALEIKIARDKESGQTKLDDVPLESIPEDPDRLKAATAFLIHREFKIPYFFGFFAIAAMATFNIESFLKMAAVLFDEMVSQRIKIESTNFLALHARND